MTRRNIELALLCIAAPLAILLFAMIALNQGEELGWASIGVPVGIFASFIVSHLALRKFAPAADPAILPICFALSSIGIAFVTRLAPDLAVRQVAWLVLGIIFMIAVIIFMKNMDKTANYKYTLMVIGLILLLSPLLPGIGNEIYGSRIWLSIGSFSFQPGEIAKIFIVLFLAGYLAQNREMLSVFTHKVGPFQFPDLSTLLFRYLDIQKAKGCRSLSCGCSLWPSLSLRRILVQRSSSTSCSSLCSTWQAARSST